MYHGHDPRRIDEYAWRDVEALLTVYDQLMTAHALGGIPDG